jgi:hypothetical protein
MARVTAGWSRRQAVDDARAFARHVQTVLTLYPH